jgi:hypothetical protein
MTGYYSRKPIETSPVLVDKRERQETEPLLLESNEVSKEARYQRGKDTSSLPPTKQRTPEDEQDRPIMYHMTGIARGIRPSATQAVMKCKVAKGKCRMSGKRSSNQHVLRLFLSHRTAFPQKWSPSEEKS